MCRSGSRMDCAVLAATRRGFTLETFSSGGWMDIPPTNSPWLSTTLIWVSMYVCMYVLCMKEEY